MRQKSRLTQTHRNSPKQNHRLMKTSNTVPTLYVDAEFARENSVVRPQSLCIRGTIVVPGQKNNSALSPHPLPLQRSVWGEER